MGIGSRGPPTSLSDQFWTDPYRETVKIKGLCRFFMDSSIRLDVYWPLPHKILGILWARRSTEGRYSFSMILIYSLSLEHHEQRRLPASLNSAEGIAKYLCHILTSSAPQKMDGIS
jgi:hypothetical protein